jgi:uncharacterized protein (DUF1684 family)
MSQDYREAVEEQREQKERYFREHPRSPIPDGHDFAGLDFYPVDPSLRFEVPLEEHDEKAEITVETTADGEQRYVRYGEFSIGIGDGAVTLQAYRPASGDERLWVPFRDATSDGETYGAGRYLDLDLEDHRTGDGEWVVDLNQAYNPTCAYNHVYECQLPPSENWLEVHVEAGEKDYPGEPAEPHDHHG